MAGVHSGDAAGDDAVGRVWMRYGGHVALAPCRVTDVAGCYAVRLALSVLGSGTRWTKPISPRQRWKRSLGFYQPGSWC